MIDISRAISPSSAVWPGDRSVDWSWTQVMNEEGSGDGGTVNIGALSMSVHTATHVDAPLHYRSDGRSVDELPLDSFVGPAQVIDVGEAETIRPQHVTEHVSNHAVDNAGGLPGRVLFKTAASGLADDEWPDSVAAFAPETIHALADLQVELIGTDAPSVDPLDSGDLPAHHALADAGILNIEGLNLAGVSPGRYTLYSCPLRIEGADAAPLRAMLGSATGAPGDPA